MNLFPPPGPQRTRLLIMIALVAVLTPVAYYRYKGSEPAITPTATPRTASNTAGAQAPVKPGARQAAPKPSAPEALKLAELEKVPDEPIAGRNPFRFGVKPPPPPPPPPPYVPPPPPAPPPPPPPPQVPLTLKSIVTVAPNTYRAYLTDASGTMFEAVDGTVIDGQYIVSKVTKDSATVEFVNGTGRKTLYIR